MLYNDLKKNKSVAVVGLLAPGIWSDEASYPGHWSCPNSVVFLAFSLASYDTGRCVGSTKLTNSTRYVVGVLRRTIAAEKQTSGIGFCTN